MFCFKATMKITSIVDQKAMITEIFDVIEK